MTHVLPRVCHVLLYVLIATGVVLGDTKMRYVNARDLSIGGRGFTDTESFFNRLPSAAKGVVRDAVGPVTAGRWHERGNFQKRQRRDQ